MPNHVQNILHLIGPEEAVSRLLDEAAKRDPDTGEVQRGTLDFDRIVPMPAELALDNGSNLWWGLAYYLATISPHRPEIPGEKMTKADFDRLWEQCARTCPMGFQAKDVSLCHVTSLAEDKRENLLETGRRVVENIQKYGCPSWYEWRIDVHHWNTKWPAYDQHFDGQRKLTFLTAWSAPHPILEALSKQHPQVTIEHAWADESLGTNCGQATYRNGRCLTFMQPDVYSVQAFDLGFSCWDMTPDSLGLALSADGTGYVDMHDMDGRYVWWNGEDGFLVEGALSRSEIPDFLYAYYWNDADGDASPLYLEKVARPGTTYTLLTRAALPEDNYGCVVAYGNEWEDRGYGATLADWVEGNDPFLKQEESYDL